MVHREEHNEGYTIVDNAVLIRVLFKRDIPLDL